MPKKVNKNKKEITKKTVAANNSKTKVKENRKLYFVKYKVQGRLGESIGVRYFDTFNEAQAFAVKVNEQKSATLLKWGANKFKDKNLKEKRK